MNKKYKILLLIIFIFSFLQQLAFAQDKGAKIVVSSVVTDESGKVLEGADILDERGTVIGASSQDGSFSVKASANSLLQIEHKGFQSVKVPVANVPEKIVMEAVPFLKDESDLIPILFGEIKKEKLLVRAIHWIFLKYLNTITYEAYLALSMEEYRECWVAVILGE